MATKTNREGLTWAEWARAAGTISKAAKAGWEAGEDPSDWRAAGVQTYPRLATRKDVARTASKRRDSSWLDALGALRRRKAISEVVQDGRLHLAAFGREE